jgi:hypothetical protein
MRKCLYVIFLIVFLPSLSIAQIDVDTIFIWDNDRGKSVQTKPAVGIIGWNSNNVFAAWQDARWGDFDIFRQRLIWDGTLIGSNTMVSFDDFNQFQQTNVDITGNPQNGCVAVWEDSAYRPYEKPSQIWCRIYNDDPIKVYELDASQKLPAISSRMNGYFAVTWTCYSGASWPSIRCKYYDHTGHELGFNVVRQRDSIVEYPPVSRVAYCDSGFIIVYEDESGDGTERSIYAQYCDKDGNIKMDHKKISHLSGDSRHEQCPDVAINEDGNIVVVWEDYRFGDADIFIQRLQAKNDRFEFVGSEMEIMTTGGVDELCPRVAVFPNGSFVVVWYDKRNGDYDAFYRAFIDGELRTPHRIPQNNVNDQMYPNIDTRYGEFSNYISMVWASQAISMYDDVFMRNFKYDDQAGTGLDSITGDIPLVPIAPDTNVGGRKCWYFDDENYDNPETTEWNEDPIPEPESVYVDLDFAIIDQLMELNTNGQYYIECEDTLPFDQGLQDRALAAYEAIFLDLGYRTDKASAGLINSTEQSALVTYIGNRNPTMVEGNDFGSDYSGTALFDKYGAQYKGDGAPYTSGNIDTLYGVSGTSFKDLEMAYDYKELVDNYVDSILPVSSDYELILESSGWPGEWAIGRTVGWGTYWDREARADSFTIYNTFMMSSIKSSTHPNTYAEYYRRCLGYLGLNCQPEPITDLMASADTVTAEGEVDISWTVVSDDTPNQSAEGDYKLKFAREKMTSETAFDNAEEYYQEWNTASQSVGELMPKTLYGLPPGNILIFALKVSDESGMWGALGAEPRDTVFGDTITPHSVCVGDNYVKDFLNTSELLDIRYDDTLFITWDAFNFYVGFARCDLTTDGDLFLYMDVTTGGADSTYPYHGASTRSVFMPDIPIFKPDYCFILEHEDSICFKQCSSKEGRDTWGDAAFNGTYCEDNIVNGHEYTEIRIPFSDMGYVADNVFKLVVIVQDDGSNNIDNCYPILNPAGGEDSLEITLYYEWSALPSGVSPRQTSNVIGVQEAADVSSILLKGKTLSVLPNPFADVTKIYMNICALSAAGDDVVLKIYDVTGRLTKQFNKVTRDPPGQITWNGTDDDGNALPAGIYFCELTAGDKREIEKVIIVK